MISFPTLIGLLIGGASVGLLVYAAILAARKARSEADRFLARSRPILRLRWGPREWRRFRWLELRRRSRNGVVGLLITGSPLVALFLFTWWSTGSVPAKLGLWIAAAWAVVQAFLLVMEDFHRFLFAHGDVLIFQDGAKIGPIVISWRWTDIQLLDARVREDRLELRLQRDTGEGGAEFRRLRLPIPEASRAEALEVARVLDLAAKAGAQGGTGNVAR